MRKELTISARFDTSDFDRSVEQMQRKLKEIYAPADMVRAQSMTSQRLQGMGLGGNLSQPSQEQYQRATQQSRRELDALIREQALGQEKLGKMIVNRIDKLKELQEQQKKLVKGSQEELEIKEKIAKVEANSFRQKESYRQRDAALNQLLDAKERARPEGIERLLQAFKGGGVGGLVTAAGRMLSTPGGAGSALSAIGGAMRTGADIYRDHSAGRVKTEVAMGNAMDNTMGRDIANIYNRRTAFEMVFSNERARAAQIALQNLQARQTADKLALGGNLASIAGGGLLAQSGAKKGALAGTAAGAVIAGIPTLGIGAPEGAAIGRIAGTVIGAAPGVYMAGKGLGNLLLDERQRSLLLSRVSDTAKNRYQSMNMEQLGEDAVSVYEGLKKQDPVKKASTEWFEKNLMRNLQAQRSLGLRNYDLYGRQDGTSEGFYGSNGFLKSITNAGFTDDMGLEMSSGILGAGGSTRMARNSAFGLQMQRGLNLTNAGQVLGTLSGSLGTSHATEQSVIKIVAEGMKRGLNDSEFAEENRRFTQVVSEIIASSGASTKEDSGRIANTFGNFLAENTTAGINAAKSAYEEYQQTSSATTGPRGVMRAAFMLRNKNLSKLSPMTQQSLMQIPEKDFNPDNPLIRNAAREASAKTGTNVTPEAIIGDLNRAAESAENRYVEADDAANIVAKELKEKGFTSFNLEDYNKLSPKGQAAFDKLVSIRSADRGYTTQRQVTSGALGDINRRAGLEVPEDIQRDRESIIDKKAKGKTGQLEDKYIEAMAKDSDFILRNFDTLRSTLSNAAEAASSFTDEVRKMHTFLKEAIKEAEKTGKKESIVDFIKTHQEEMTKLIKGAPDVGKVSK